MELFSDIFTEKIKFCWLLFLLCTTEERDQSKNLFPYGDAYSTGKRWENVLVEILCEQQKHGAVQLS